MTCKKSVPLENIEVQLGEIFRYKCWGNGMLEYLRVEMYDKVKENV